MNHRPLGALLVCQEVGEDWPPPLSHLDLVSSDLYQVGVISDDNHLCGHQDRPQGRRGTNQKEAVVGRGGEGDTAHYHMLLLLARTCDPQCQQCPNTECLFIPSTMTGSDLHTVQGGWLQF